MKPLEDDRERHRSIHERWRRSKNRDRDDPSFRDEWYGEQCGACRHYVPLSGHLGGDYGACTNEASPCDRRVMFEHDGCEAFEAGGQWD